MNFELVSEQVQSLVVWEASSISLSTVPMFTVFSLPFLLATTAIPPPRPILFSHVSLHELASHYQAKDMLHWFRPPIFNGFSFRMIYLLPQGDDGSQMPTPLRSGFLLC